MLKKASGGEGATEYLIKPTEKFKTLILDPLLKKHEARVERRLRDFQRTPFSVIMKNLKRRDTKTRETALQMLALRLVFFFDLEFAGWRKAERGSVRAGANLVAESKRLVRYRWLIHCGAGQMELDDLATEYGIASYLGCRALLAATSRDFAPDAQQYAESMRRHSNIDLILISGGSLQDMNLSPCVFMESVLSQAPAVLCRRS